MKESDKKILEKVISGNSSKENAQHVVSWFSDTIEGQETLSDLIDLDAYLFQEKEFCTQKMSDYRSRHLYEQIVSKIKYKETKRKVLSVAAIILPVILIATSFLYVNSRMALFEKEVYTEIYVPKTEKVHMVFQDGTEVYLNSDSKLKYPKKFSWKKRKVYLEGEAYFNVTSNKHRPFIVETLKGSVKVLGTSFNVQDYSNQSQMLVTLDEGAVSLTTRKHHYEMKPGQQVTYNSTGDSYLVQNFDKNNNVTLWKNEILVLHDTPLTDLLKILERRFDLCFKIKDNKALQYTFTLKTEERDYHKILMEVEKVAPIKFNFKNNIYEISM